MANEESSWKKPSVLILGGCGFIGRNLVQYLLEKDSVSEIVVADKVPPQTAWLNKTHKDCFLDRKVEFRSANLIYQASVERAFEQPDGQERFDFVINLAAETKYGQGDAVYKDGILKLTQMCAAEAARRKVKRFVELSSGQLYSTGKDGAPVVSDNASVETNEIDQTAVVPAKESTAREPWTKVAKYKSQAEDQLRALLPELNYVVLRPAIVYGIGDKQGLTPRLIIGAVYKILNEKMQLLWTKDLKMNTVHVDDVCRAIWHVCHHGNAGEVYNLVDKGETTQGRISSLISEMFNINYDYIGPVMSNLARLDMSSTVEDINDKHMAPWAEILQKEGIGNTPLTPYIDQELLYNKHIYLDGSKIESTGFKYEHLELCKKTLVEVVQDFTEMGLFPSELTPG